tara:strand:- start:286 stop:924 length:639 start_codon:yes stop_codon:yes gene_type:complete
MATSNVSTTIISKLYKSRKILLEQLTELGYNTNNYEGFSINEVNIMFNKKQLDMLIDSEDVGRVYIKYGIYKKLSENSIYETITDLFEMGNILNKETDRIIFIIKGEPNDTMMNIQEQIWHADKYYISVINLDRLQYNLLEHSLVPKHIILNDGQTKEFLEKYNIINPEKQLPTISRFDPVAQAIGLKPGKICEIIRNSETSILTEYYRICV